MDQHISDRKSKDDAGPIRAALDAASASDSLVRHEASHQAMGTFFSIAAYGRDSQVLQDSIARAFVEIDRLDDLMSNYKPGSELSNINREAIRQPVVITPELFNLLERSVRYSEETDGAFDVTVGPLMKSWGFFRGWGRLPEKAELSDWLDRIGYRHVKLDTASRTIKFDKPGIELDLGAIGKGYAVDRVVEMLRAEGVTRALVSSGTSSIYALGAPPGETGWKISICDPLDRRKQACSVRLQDLSISISGSYEKSFVLDGKLYTHLLDPRNGMPAEDMLMTGVIAVSNTATDALSTAFFVSGVEQTEVYLQNHSDLAAIFFVPTHLSRSVQQVTLQSSVMTLPEGSFTFSRFDDPAKPS
jgi:thiamine biosynthesis lipoprotein